MKYVGHELISANLFEDFCVGNRDVLGTCNLTSILKSLKMSSMELVHQTDFLSIHVASSLPATSPTPSELPATRLSHLRAATPGLHSIMQHITSISILLVFVLYLSVKMKLLKCKIKRRLHICGWNWKNTPVLLTETK
jgi:hypothetical protein